MKNSYKDDICACVVVQISYDPAFLQNIDTSHSLLN